MSLLIDQLDRYAVIAAVINLSSIFVIRFMLLKWISHYIEKTVHADFADRMQ